MIASLVVIGLLSVFAFTLFDRPFAERARNDSGLARSRPSLSPVSTCETDLAG
jgi:hypothetical protein